jgi:hypothetical protein
MFTRCRCRRRCLPHRPTRLDNPRRAPGRINWLFSFLSADKNKSYCLYEADNPEAIREAARRLNIPADAIIEVGEMPADSPVTKWSLLR